MHTAAEPSHDRPVVALIGPTGSGKSAIALAHGVRHGAEIVAADAFTVYRGMDIGTAKPTPADRELVRHHMIDALDPDAECTVSWFQRAARAAVADVHQRGQTPLLVGGSGLYFRAVVDPLRFPPTSVGVRQRLNGMYSGDPDGAHRHLAEIDPAAAAKIEPGNIRRTVRALEVIELTGERFSDFSAAWEDFHSVYASLRVVGISWTREQLSERINARVDSMLDAGWLDEVRGLATSSGGLSKTARQAIGYAELLDHLEGRITLTDAVAQIRARTRKYAVRQERWFAKDPRVQWVAPQQVAGVLEELIR